MAAGAVELQKFLEFGLGADGNADIAGAEIVTAFAHQNLMARKFPEKGGAGLAEVSEQEVRVAGEDPDTAILQFVSKPCAEALHITNVTRDGFAFFHSSYARHQCSEIHRIRRHGAAHKSEGIALADHRA